MFSVEGIPDEIMEVTMVPPLIRDKLNPSSVILQVPVALDMQKGSYTQGELPWNQSNGFSLRAHDGGTMKRLIEKDHTAYWEESSETATSPSGPVQILMVLT